MKFVLPCIKIPKSDIEVLKFLDIIDNLGINVTIEESKGVLVFENLEDWLLFTKYNKDLYIQIQSSKKMLNLWKDGSLGQGPALLSGDGIRIFFGNGRLFYNPLDSEFTYVGGEGIDPCQVSLQIFCRRLSRGSKRCLPLNRKIGGFIHRLLQFGYNFSYSRNTESINDAGILDIIRSETYCQEISRSTYIKNISNNYYPPKLSVQEENIETDTMRVWINPLKYKSIKLCNEFGLDKEKAIIRNTQYPNHPLKEYMISGGVCKIYLAKDIEDFMYFEYSCAGWERVVNGIPCDGLYYCSSMNPEDKFPIPELAKGINNFTWRVLEEGNKSEFLNGLVKVDNSNINKYSSEIIERYSIFKDILKENAIINSL